MIWVIVNSAIALGEYAGTFVIGIKLSLAASRSILSIPIFRIDRILIPASFIFSKYSRLYGVVCKPMIPSYPLIKSIFFSESRSGTSLISAPFSCSQFLKYGSSSFRTPNAINFIFKKPSFCSCLYYIHDDSKTP